MGCLWLLPDMAGLSHIIDDKHKADTADKPYKRLMEGV